MATGFDTHTNDILELLLRNVAVPAAASQHNETGCKEEETQVKTESYLG